MRISIDPGPILFRRAWRTRRAKRLFYADALYFRRHVEIRIWEQENLVATFTLQWEYPLLPEYEPCSGELRDFLGDFIKVHTQTTDEDDPTWSFVDPLPYEVLGEKLVFPGERKSGV